MAELNITSQQTPVETNAFIEPSLSRSGAETPVLEQHGIQLDPFAQFYIIAQLLYRFLRDYTRTGHPTSCSGHEIDQHHDGISIHANSVFRIPTQDLCQFLKHDAFTDSEEPSFAGENGTTPHPASLWIPGSDLYQFLQHHAHTASELPSFGDGHEIPAGQNDMPADAPLLFIPMESLSKFLQPYEIPSVSQDLDDQVDAQPDEATASIVHVCPVCQRPFRRVQERNRHLESYLPHSIICPFQGCTWTGRRQWDFQEHWRGKHIEAGQPPGEVANVIYDTGDFVRLIVDGTPVKEVALSAFAMVPEGLRRLGKPDVGVNVLGRNRDLKKWIRIPS